MKSKFQRKFRKLIKHPKLFIKDFYKNRMESSRGRFIKKESNFSYTIVSAVYNTGIYLDDFFRSIVNQSVNFKSHIKIILVNDGSTDNSEAIILKWQKKYPKNIKYIYKDNGGQASARNIGLKYVETDWVTFIDSDDFINKDYIETVDNIACSDKAIKLICCNQIFYLEDKNQFIDKHPLNYRFKNELTILPSNDLNKHMQFSAPLAFFSVKDIPATLKFDEELKPTFEDGKFVSLYILSLKNSKVCFNSKAKYFNRKRSDKSSTMDNAWSNKGQFGQVLEQGYIKTLEAYQDKLGYIPDWMQRTILWELLRLVKRIVDKEHNIHFLSEEEKNNLLSLMDKTFGFIDKRVILRYELGACGFSRKVGMLGCFKNEIPDNQIIYIDEIDNNKNEILVRYFSSADSIEQFYIDGEFIQPITRKVQAKKFINRTFVNEIRLWLPFTAGKLSAKIDNKKAQLNYLGVKFNNNVNLTSPVHKKSSNIWLFMDRDDSAMDNAEFLYEYVAKLKQKKCFFLIGKNCSDWQRLSLKGFNLVEYGSNEHAELLKECDAVISSQTRPLLNQFESLTTNYKKIFLQHGVIKDNLANWLNSCQFDMMLTSSINEYQDIIKNNGTYKYTKKEIKLTGLPRFDSLIKNNNGVKKQILILPTWRKNVTGNLVDKVSSIREINTKFCESSYALALNSLIQSKSLEKIAKEHEVDIVFCPHPNIRPYLQYFKPTSAIRIANESESIHFLLSNSSMLITDYSSVAFDFAYMQKPLCYYQFDEDDFYNGGHTYTKGYFDYRRDGFGPVINTEDKLIEYIKNCVDNNFLLSNKVYLERISNTFYKIDSNNCKRVYDEIINSLSNESSNLFNEEEAYNYAIAATKLKLWKIAEERWRYYCVNKFNFSSYKNPYVFLIESLRKQGKIDKAFDVFKNDIGEDFSSDNDLMTERAKLKTITQCWSEAIKDFELVNEKSIDIPEYKLCLAHTGMLHKHLKLNSSFDIISDHVFNIDEVYIARSKKQWSTIVRIFDGIETKHSTSNADKNSILSKTEFLENRCWLLKAEAYRYLGAYDQANQCLINYESYIKNDPFCRFEIAKLAYEKKQWGRVLSQLDKAVLNINLLSAELLDIYFFAAEKVHDENQLNDLYQLLTEDKRLYPSVLIAYGKSCLKLKKWTEAANCWKLTLGLTSDSYYNLALSLRHLGAYIEAFKFIKLYDGPTKPEILLLRAELAQLNEDWSEVYTNLLTISRAFPDYAEENSIDRIQTICLAKNMISPAEVI